MAPPDFAIALEQHARYCDALESCGPQVTRLAEDPAHPDATFVEDTAGAILSARCNVLTRPGAASRAGEVTAIGKTLESLGIDAAAIESPGTLDGGDICDAGGHLLHRRVATDELGWRGAARGAAREIAVHLVRALIFVPCPAYSISRAASRRSETIVSWRSSLSRTTWR